MDKARIGLIGVGWMGSHHGHNILRNPQAELVGIASRTCDQDKLKQFPVTEGVSRRCYKHYEDLLEQDDLNAVVIASPNHVHAEQAVAAAQAGKHIYLEKPMALNLDDCKRIVREVKQAGVKFLIGYHRRFNPLYQYAKKLAADGDLGKLFFVESDYVHHMPSDWPIWSWIGKAAIGGSIFHAGSGHNVDLIRFFGGEIAEVACFKDVLLPRDTPVDTEDTAVAIFRFANGMIGKVMLCVGAIVPFTFNLKLFGSKGTIVNNQLWLDSTPAFYELGHEKDYISLPESWVPDNVMGGVGEPWDKCMDHFVDILVKGVPSLNDVDSAYRTSEACFAVTIAAQEKRVVTLPVFAT